MSLCNYIGDQLIDILVRNGADNLWVEEVEKKEKITTESIEHPVYESVSVGKLNMAGKALGNLISLKNKSADDQIDEYVDILAEKLCGLKNEYNWINRILSIGSLVKLLSIFFIVASFSFDKFLSLDTQIEQKSVLIILCGIISISFYFIDGLFTNPLVQNAAASIILVKILHCYVKFSPLNANNDNALVYSVLWGSMVFLVTGIKSVRGMKDYLSGYKSQAKSEIWSALLGFLGLTIGLMVGKIIGIDYLTKIKDYQFEKFELIRCLRIVLAGTGSIGFLVLFTSTTREKNIIDGFFKIFRRVFLYSIGIGTVLVIQDCLFQKISLFQTDEIKNIIFKNIISVVVICIITSLCYFFCHGYMKKNFKDMPETILFIPSIVVLIPGCSLCEEIVNSCEEIVNSCEEIVNSLLPFYKLLAIAAPIFFLSYYYKSIENDGVLCNEKIIDKLRYTLCKNLKEIKWRRLFNQEWRKQFDKKYPLKKKLRDLSIAYEYLKMVNEVTDSNEKIIFVKAANKIISGIDFSRCKKFEENDQYQYDYISQLVKLLATISGNFVAELPVAEPVVKELKSTYPNFIQEDGIETVITDMLGNDKSKVKEGYVQQDEIEGVITDDMGGDDKSMVEDGYKTICSVTASRLRKVIERYAQQWHLEFCEIR